MHIHVWDIRIASTHTHAHISVKYIYLPLNSFVFIRIAVNSQYVTSILGIKNPVHRQKLSLKATDLVLFGHKKSEYYLINNDIFCVIPL